MPAVGLSMADDAESYDTGTDLHAAAAVDDD